MYAVLVEGVKVVGVNWNARGQVTDLIGLCQEHEIVVSLMSGNDGFINDGFINIQAFLNGLIKALKKLLFFPCCEFPKKQNRCLVLRSRMPKCVVWGAKLSHL